MADLPGRALAQELINKSRAESRRTPMEAVIQAVQEGNLRDDEGFRLIVRLWTLGRMFYYIYGGRGQGLEINDFPPSVKCFFCASYLVYVRRSACRKAIGMRRVGDGLKR